MTVVNVLLGQFQFHFFIWTRITRKIFLDMNDCIDRVDICLMISLPLLAETAHIGCDLSSLVLSSEDLTITLLDRICNTKVIEQPLIAMASIGMRLETVLLPPALTTAALCTDISTPPATLGYTRHAEFAWADFDVLAMQRTARVGMQARELS